MLIAMIYLLAADKLIETFLEVNEFQ